MKATLTKESGTILKNMKRKTVYLCDKKLRYYEEDDSYPKGVIDFDRYQVEVCQPDPNDIYFELTLYGHKKVFRFDCQHPREAELWVKAI